MTGAMALLLGAMLLVRRAPDLPLSRFLNEWLAVRPARWLLRRSRREVLAYAMVAVMLAFAGEYVLVMGGPQVALSLAVDLAAYADAVIAVAALASVARMRAVTGWLTRKAVAARPGQRAPRARRAMRVRPASNDSDDDRPGLLAA